MRQTWSKAGIIKGLCPVLCAVLCLTSLLPSFSRAEGIGSELLAVLDAGSGYTVEATVAVRSVLPYDQRRSEQLNDLLKHMVLEITRDGEKSRTAVKTDGETVLSVTSRGQNMIYSFDTDTVYTFGEDGMASDALEELLLPDPEDGVAFVLERFTPDRLRALDDGFEALGSIPEKLPELVTETAVKTKIKNVGTAVRKVTVTAKKADVEAGIMTRGTEGVTNPYLAFLLKRMVYTGKQKVTLFYDEAGTLLKADYSGQAGTAEDRRDVVMSWTRSAAGQGEKLVFKAQPVSGSDRDALQVTRKEDGESLEITFEYDRTRDRSKLEITGFVILRKEETTLLEAEIVSKRGEETEKLAVNGRIDYEDALSWRMESDLLFNRNKKTVFDGTVGLNVQIGSGVDWTGNTEPVLLAQGSEEYEAFRKKMATALIVPLLRLPAEDTCFLTEGLEQGE